MIAMLHLIIQFAPLLVLGMLAPAEKLIPLAEAAREFLGRPLSPATLWRWSTKGVRGARLATTHVGGRCYTTRAALEKFAAESTAARRGESPAPTGGRDAETTAKLQEAGLL